MEERQIDHAQAMIEAGAANRIAAIRMRVADVASAIECVDCGEDIPEKRRLASPGAKRCILCQKARETR